MPTDQPNDAADPEDLPMADARDDRTAAAVLSDDQPDAMPGGGGLIGGGRTGDGGTGDGGIGGGRIGGGQGGIPGATTGGASPNSPLGDTAVGGGDPEAEARRRTAGASPGKGPALSR